MSRVEPESFLTLHYRLSGPRGDVVSTFGGKPATLSLGGEQLTPVLQHKLLGMNEGEHQIFEIPAGEAFGERNPDLLQWVTRDELNVGGRLDTEYTVGEVVRVPTHDGQAEFAAAVRQVQDDGRILLDFNHPLAGEAVTFEVQLIGIL